MKLDLMILFISFVPPKEMNQRKGVLERQPCPVCPLAAQGFKGATKQNEVRTFPGLPAHSFKFMLLTNN